MMTIAQQIDSLIEADPKRQWMKKYRDYFLMTADAEAYLIGGEQIAGHVYVRDESQTSGVKAIKSIGAKPCEYTGLLALRQIDKAETIMDRGVEALLSTDALLQRSLHGEQIDVSLAALNVLRTMAGDQPSLARDFGESVSLGS